jgi:NADPH:quinone reductase-like Zn-dependent oxidoreductase
MKAAVVTETGKPPVYGNFVDPKPAEGAQIIAVAASALTQLAKSRASGTHYSFKGVVPFVPGVDGTGTRDDGRRVYFILPEAPFGGMAERTLVKTSLCVDLPSGLDDVKAAGIANPGMSSWAALKERARFVKGETVLISGATGIAGRLAVQVAKYLGARKVIATGRNAKVLQALPAMGADVTVDLTRDAVALEEEFMKQFGEGVDVVLDYLWGESAVTLLVAAAKSAPEAVPIRFVSIGSAAGPNISLPSAVLRSSALELMGSGISSVPLARLLKAIEELFSAVGPGGFEIPIESVPLSRVGERWSSPDSGARTVFTPH